MHVLEVNLLQASVLQMQDTALLIIMFIIEFDQSVVTQYVIVLFQSYKFFGGFLREAEHFTSLSDTGIADVL